VPAFLLDASYPIAALPPAVGGVRTTTYSLLLAGPGDGIFFPLVPSRF